jgi:hypothetical protein
MQNRQANTGSRVLTDDKLSEGNFLQEYDGVFSIRLTKKIYKTNLTMWINLEEK